jgi:thioredoxin 1
MAIMNTSDENFDQDVINVKGSVLVDFWAEWCGPCHRIAPTLKELATEVDTTICKLDITTNPKTMEKYDVRGLPTLLLFKDGTLVGRKVGALAKAQILDFIQTNG